MFGLYEFFPESYHGAARFSYEGRMEELQKVIILSLYQLNLGKGKLRSCRSAQPKMSAILEFGIADGITFSYLDREMWTYYRKNSRKQPFQTLDFLCIARYYVAAGDKQKPLRFDYYILRFLFQESEVEVQVFHEKGTQRLSVGDLIAVLVKRFNREMKKRKLGHLKKSYLRML